MAPLQPLTPAYEIWKIQERLGLVGHYRAFDQIHVARPEGMAAVEFLRRRKVVEYDLVDGIMVVRRAGRGMTPCLPHDAGGDVA